MKTNRNETTARVQVQAQAGDPETANTNEAGDPQAGDPGDPSDPDDPEADPEAEPGDNAAVTQESAEAEPGDKPKPKQNAEASHREKGRQG